MAWTWEDLKTQVQPGEMFTEGNPQHEAVLVSRWLHAQRAAAEPDIATDVVPPNPSLAPESDPLMTAETPAG